MIDFRLDFPNFLQGELPHILTFRFLAIREGEKPADLLQAESKVLRSFNETDSPYRLKGKLPIPRFSPWWFRQKPPPFIVSDCFNAYVGCPGQLSYG
jgi:hypothetical protein